MYVNYHNYYANFTPPDNFLWGEPCDVLIEYSCIVDAANKSASKI